MLMLITFFVLSFVLGCATVSPGPALLVSGSPTVVIQVPDSEISPYFLAELYDPIFISETAVKETADSKIPPDYFSVLSIFNETPFPITEPTPEQTLVSEIQYYLEEIYDYDEPFFITKTSGKN